MEICSETLEDKYLSLKKLYEEALKEKKEALEENERATVSFAVHFDQEVSVLDDHIETLAKERDKATTEVENLTIKLENRKYELDRLQREHIKQQLEQEKCLDRIEKFVDKLKKVEEENNILKEQVETLKEDLKGNTMEKNEDEEDEHLLINTEHNRPRTPVAIRKSKIDDDYNVHEELGRGKFGVVKRVTKKDTNEEFAAKWVKVSSQTKDDVLQEIKIMGRLNHKRLVGLYDAYEISRNIVLIMEYITGGELFERIATSESVTEKECAHYMRQLLEGVQYMHKQHIVHLDLKPENIVCVGKDTCDIKLIDFGLAKELKPGTSVKTMQGTPEFVAPEVINFDPVSLASDMWSVGVIAYILISGLSPFLGDDDNETLSLVTAAEYDFEDDAFDDISNEAKDFIERLLQKAPSKRKNAEECLKHEWIKKNKGNNKIKTENLKKFLAKRRWQKSVNAVRAVRRLSSMSSLLNASTKLKSKSVVKLDEEKDANKPLSASKREFSKSTPSVFDAEQGQLSKRAMKILLDSDEGSQSESGSLDTLNCSNVDDKDVLEGLFKENKEILEFLTLNKEKESPKKTLTLEKLGEISEEKELRTAKPSFLERLPTMHTVPKGTPVLMTCTVAGYPTPKITWSRNGQDLKKDESDIKIDVEDDVCTLSIGQCELQDEGRYSCKAENSLGQTTSNTNLEVQVGPDFVQEMKDVSVEERRRVQFDVEVSGKPFPTIQWYHNNDVIQEDRFIKIRKTDNISSLVIRSATPERKGNYKCVLTNPLDTISCSGKLHIQGYSDDEEEINEEEEEEEEKEEGKEVEDEVDNQDKQSQVSLRQDNIELYYDIKDEIGKGRFGVIRYGVHKTTGRDYAIKYIKVRRSQKDEFQQEIDIMNHLRHRRFIRLYEAFEEPRRIILVLELMRGGELLERVSEKDYVTEHEVVRYVKQILEGVKDMHENGVLHLDLKPQNIMFTSADSDNLKLIDFGLARKLNNKEDLKILFGTPEFVAPEVVNYEVITPATDMWSVGVITYVLLSGVSPFWNSDPDITLTNVTKAAWRLPDLLFQGVSQDAKDFLSLLLVKDASKRIKVEKALDHPWIKTAQNDEEGNNLFSTERLRKYHAHQKGLLSSHEVVLCETLKTAKDKNGVSQNPKGSGEVDQKKCDSDSQFSTETNVELKEEFEVLLEKYNALEEELYLVKASKKDQQKAFNELEKRNSLLEERNIANQEATHHLIKLECDKKEIEEKYQQKEMKLHNLSKKYADLREKASSFDVLEEKVSVMEKERKISVNNNKMMEEKLEKLRVENRALHESHRTMGSIENEDVFTGTSMNIRDKEELENKVELLSKDLEIARAEIQRLGELVNAQLEDLEEMERITEHKRKLEARCKSLEEQMVELEQEGTEREKEIDDMEEDIGELQEKLEKSHNGLRVALEENKKLKERLDVLRREEGGIEHGEDMSDVEKQNGHEKLVNGFHGSLDDENFETMSFKEDKHLSAKLLQLDKGLQTLMSNRSHGDDGVNENEEKEDERDDKQGGKLLDLLKEVLEIWETTSEKMDVKQLRQLSKKLMKANQSLLSTNEKLNRDKHQFEIENEQLREGLERKLQSLEKENNTLKRLLKPGDSINAVDEILRKTTIEALESELSSQQGEIHNLKKSNKDLEQLKMEKKVEEENIQWRLEQKVKRVNNDKSLLVSNYEKELEECQTFYLEEQSKLKRLCDERIASVEKQNQNLKSQINELMIFNENKKNNCEEHAKQLNELKRLHQEEVQEFERNLALTLSQELHALTSLAEQEKTKIRQDKDAEINKLNGSRIELDEIITGLEEQVTKYPELLEEKEDLKNKLIIEKDRYELLEKELKTEKEEDQTCEDCVSLERRISELESELVALRKLEEDNMLLASENEKLIEELEIERKKLELAAASGTEAKMKLEELDNEKNPSKSKENSKKSLKKRVSQLETNCKDLTWKLQSEILKGKQQQLEISRETSEKERILQTLLKFQESNNNSDEGGQMNEGKQKKDSDVLDGYVSVKDLSGENSSSLSEEKDNDYHIIKEELKKSQNRTYLLQTEIDRLRESYSNNLSKELEEMENKWTQRLRRECNAVHSEMAEEFRKQKEVWRKKESQLHSVIKELQIQVEDIERERRELEKEWKRLKANVQNGAEFSEKTLELPPDEDMKTNTLLGDEPVLTQDLISDRDLRRVAYKLKKDQWSRLGSLLVLSETDIREIDVQKVGKEEKAFRMLCQWRTSAQHTAGNQVSQLASALDEIRRKDLGQFVTELCMARKSKKKLIGW